MAIVSGRSGALELWLSDADGRNPRQLTRLNQLQAGFPRWSRDGRHITFHTWAGVHPQIFVVDVDSGSEPLTRVLTNAAFGFFSPDWSIDGAWVYANTATGLRRTLRIPVAGGQPEELFEGITPIVAKDGRTILYARLNHRGVFARKLNGDVSTNPEERLVEDYQPPAADINPTDDGFYYVGCDVAGNPRAVRFYSYSRKASVDVMDVEDSIGFARGLAVSPDRRRLIYGRNTGSGTDLALVVLR